MSGIYIHIPFCKKKCNYCDFYSITDLSYENIFVESLIKEIELTEDVLPKIETIFIGGGTPSIMSSKNLDKLINALNKKFDLSNLIEFSIETNPGTLNSNLLKSYFESGINRLSLGVQSLIDKELNFLQRIHSPEEAIENIISARQIGFKNINADLIFSLPGQTLNNLIYNIDTLINCGITHLSAYSLIYEEGTALYKDLINNKIARTDDDIESDIYLSMIEHLNQLNFNQYEISNFSYSGYECLHNLNYWRRKQYLGFGPAAHSFINNKRYLNSPDLKNYIEILKSTKLPIIEIENIDNEKTISEIIYLGLRAEGLNLNTLKPFITEISLNRIINYSKILEKDFFLTCRNNIINLTAKGFSMCDNITVKFLDLV